MRPAITKLVNICKEIVVRAVEVGVGEGRNAKDMLEHIPNLNLTLIENNTDMLPVIRTALKGFEGKYAIMAENSVEVADSICKQQFNFVYIDADHSYEAVRNDIKKWYPKVIVGGILAGHDYGNEACPGVIKAVNEFVFDRDLFLHTADLDWWVIRE